MKYENLLADYELKCKVQKILSELNTMNYSDAVQILDCAKFLLKATSIVQFDKDNDFDEV